MGELAKIVSEQDPTRLTNHLLYHPGSNAGNASVGAGAGGFGQNAYGATGGRGFNQNGSGRRGFQGNNNRAAASGTAHASQAVPTPSNPELRTQNISIPSDMGGCIIGRGGTKINEIRTQSGAKISIAKDAHDESGERMFTITGSSEALEKALFLLYSQERARRVRGAHVYHHRLLRGSREGPLSPLRPARGREGEAHSEPEAGAGGVDRQIWRAAQVILRIAGALDDMGRGCLERCTLAWPRVAHGIMALPSFGCLRASES